MHAWAFVLSGLLSAAEPGPADLFPKPQKPEPARAVARSAVILGADAFAELLPGAAQQGPNRRGQYLQSLMTGVRMSFGYRHESLFRGLLIVETGYAAARLEPGTGQDGIMFGLGAEGDYIAHELLIVFARATANWNVARWAAPDGGTLTDRAILFALGVRALKAVDLHVGFGSDFAGVLTFGVGAAVGWQWAIET